ncbi:MAG TPA: PfkB family carbohydrate kinase [Gemmatimonadales bacterium]|nr:PfkB family carbohydrate kinase [Gemmatimonadales bacterium]
MIGSMVWDTIYDRDPAQGPIEEWGGIAYALAALDATLPEDWAVVPLVKVGRDLAPRANEFLRGLRRTARGARFIEVPQPNNRVTLRYLDNARRCEQMRGGVPPWTWPELGPLVADLDALYVNFISGFEMTLETARLLRHGFPRFIYADLHSLFLGKEPDGTRVPQPLPDAPEWFGCFDVIQLNEDEMRQLGRDPMQVAAGALARGCRALLVTLGPRGVAYFAASQPAGGGTGDRSLRLSAPVQTARIPVDPADRAPASGGDPTGCGDVFGATAVAALVSGAALEDALRLATRMAARNLTHRGATGLRDHLLGRLARA